MGGDSTTGDSSHSFDSHECMRLNDGSDRCGTCRPGYHLALF